MDFGKQVLVELSPSCVGVARLVGGRCAHARRMRIDAREATDADGLMVIWRDALRRLVGEMGLAGQATTVVLTSPDIFVGAYGCAHSAGQRAARRAAELALAEASSIDSKTSPFALRPVHVDSPASGSQRQVHTLGQIAGEAHVAQVSAVIEGVGLRFEGLTSAPFLAALAGIEFARAHAGKVHLVAHVGDHESIFLGMAGGRLRFVRHVPLGIETLVQSIAREPLDCVEGEPVRLDAAASRELLDRAGIPAPGEGVGVGSGRSSTAVLPRVQATLQRMALEARQSLRFGFGEDERGGVSLAVTGAGANVPRLGEVLAEMSGLGTAAVAAPTNAAGASPGIQQYLALGRPGAVLAPRGVVEKMIGRSLRRGLWMGAAAAALVLAGALWQDHAALSRVNERIATLSGQAGSDESLRALTARMQAIGARLEEATSALAGELGQSAPWSGAMIAIAGALPDGMRVTSMDMRTSDGANTCQIAGVARSPAGREASALIREFLDRLSAMPIVSNCRLESTSKVGSGDGSVQFQVQLEVLGLPGLAHEPEDAMEATR